MKTSGVLIEFFMRPPLPSPDGYMHHDELPEHNGQELSVSYTLSVLSQSRLILKFRVFSPAKLLSLAIACLAVGMMMSSFREIVGVAIWIIPPLFLSLAVVFSFLLSPIIAYGRLLTKGRENILTLNNGGISEVANNNSTPRKNPFFKSPSTSFDWKQILWIIDWSGDIIMVTWSAGVFVPREAFGSEQERLVFLGAARRFQHQAR